MSHFSDTLISLRKMYGMTQQQVADRTGLTRSAVGMYETGKREPDFETLQQIAEFYHVDMNTLITGETADTGEMDELLETLRRREDMRMLFKLAKDATPEDVRSAVRIIEALRND